MEVYKTLLKLKDEPCYNILKSNIDEFYLSPNYLKVNNLYVMITSDLFILSKYHLVSLDDCKRLNELMLQSMQQRFHGYYICVRNSNTSSNDKPLVYKSNNNFLLCVLCFLIIVVCMFFWLSPEFMHTVFDFWKSLLL